MLFEIHHKLPQCGFQFRRESWFLDCCET